MADEGSGATLTFGTTGVSLAIVTIQGTGVTRASMDTTNLATTGAKTFIAGDTFDPGELSATFQYDPDTQPPYSNAAETITLTYPVPSGSSNGATEASSGFVTSWDAGNCEVDSVMMGSVTIKRTGTVTYTDAS